MGALLLKDLKKSINKTRLKIAVLKWHPGLPGANEFKLKMDFNRNSLAYLGGILRMQAF